MKTAVNFRPLRTAGVLLGIGFGLFNFVEGIIDHQILQLHHVVQRAAQPAQFYWDLSFLASGLVLMGLGLRFARR